jgi:hypothetical protein
MWILVAIKLEKRKRKRGKRLNLLDEKNNGLQLFSPARIARARAILAAKGEAEKAAVRASYSLAVSK